MGLWWLGSVSPKRDTKKLQFKDQNSKNYGQPFSTCTIIRNEKHYRWMGNRTSTWSLITPCWWKILIWNRNVIWKVQSLEIVREWLWYRKSSPIKSPDPPKYVWSNKGLHCMMTNKTNLHHLYYWAYRCSLNISWYSATLHFGSVSYSAFDVSHSREQNYSTLCLESLLDRGSIKEGTSEKKTNWDLENPIHEINLCEGDNTLFLSFI